MNRYVCVHGHFYQPPRENPWLEEIERQDSARPFHDWNERITAECYGPNGEARILDPRGRITGIVNNYADISFNFGPTLLKWLADHAPDTYGAILAADRLSIERFRGHGSAMAQSYGHMILPLANRADRRTQVHWGVRDFQHRFGRAPEGMWLAETAADTPSLEALAAEGIRFTVLAPNQAAAVRPLDRTGGGNGGKHGGGDWYDVSDGSVDPRMPYLVRLPSGREITVFFYDGPASRAVAFEGLLTDGARFAQRLTGLLQDRRDAPQLAHIATDGESYGHHHRHGEMALAFALQHIRDGGKAELINYASYLAKHPPTHEARIVEASSWSCAHGVERWRSDCGCHTGGQEGWHQRWRAPLREALDWLRDALAPAYEEAARPLLGDPWAARDDYVDVILDRSPANVSAFLERHAGRDLQGDDRVAALQLLELQRHAMLMYTSCGWFFNELSGIETVQVLHYAGRAVQLAELRLGLAVEDGFVERLATAESNLPQLENGARIWETMVRPARVDLPRVAAHYAVSSLFDPEGDHARVYCYDVDVEQADRRASGDAALFAGRVRITSSITGASAPVTFAVLHMGGPNVNGGTRASIDPGRFGQLREGLVQPFEDGDFAAVVQRLAHEFPDYTFSLRSLFADRQREILYRILRPAVQEAGDGLARIYGENANLMRFLAAHDQPLPGAFRLAAEYALNSQLRAALDAPRVDAERVRRLLAEADEAHVGLDTGALGWSLGRALRRQALRLREDPDDLGALEELAAATTLLEHPALTPDLGPAQNLTFSLLRDAWPAQAICAEEGDEMAARWVELFRVTGERLHIAVE